MLDKLLDVFLWLDMCELILHFAESMDHRSSTIFFKYGFKIKSEELMRAAFQLFPSGWEGNYMLLAHLDRGMLTWIAYSMARDGIWT
jgi:hypothetical protein